MGSRRKFNILYTYGFLLIYIYFKLINKQFVDPWGMKGITIWTDFCGEIPSLRDAMVQVNRNMDAGVDQFANIVAVVPGAAISPVPAAGKPLFTFNNPLSGYTSLAARGNPLPNPALPVIAPVPPVLVAPAIGAPVLSFKVVEGKRKLRKARHDKKQHQKVLVGHQEQSFLQVSNYVTPLRWCDDPEDEETTIDTRDRKTSDCFEVFFFLYLEFSNLFFSFLLLGPCMGWR